MTDRQAIKHTAFMGAAHLMASQGTCLRLKVGCVLLHPDGSTAGTGYNGALPGQPHCIPEECNPNNRCFRTRHAERSALDYSLGEIGTAYVTHEPCLRCTQDLIARGCRRVYWTTPYPISDPTEAYWRARHVLAAGVEWRRMAFTGDFMLVPAGLSLELDEQEAIFLVYKGQLTDIKTGCSSRIPFCGKFWLKGVEDKIIKDFLRR